MMALNYDKISLTAKLAAYMRQFTDIPFAKDVSERLHAPEAFDSLLHDSRMSPGDLLWYAPIFEVRYKSIAEVIRQSGIRQVLELAGGISLRGLAMTRDLDMIYVDTDLEEITEQKIALVADIRREHGLALRGDLRLVAANALDPMQLQVAVKDFQRDQPIVVVNEGLFPYLSASEMQAVARNARDLLARFGGLWITPDFTVKSDVKDVSEQQRRFREIVARATDRSMYNNAFDNEEQLQAFLDRLGLKGQVLNQLDLAPNVVSVDALKLSHELLDRTRPTFKLWVLSVTPRGA